MLVPIWGALARVGQCCGPAMIFLRPSGLALGYSWRARGGKGEQEGRGQTRRLPTWSTPHCLLTEIALCFPIDDRGGGSELLGAGAGAVVAGPAEAAHLRGGGVV